MQHPSLESVEKYYEVFSTPKLVSLLKWPLGSLLH